MVDKITPSFPTVPTATPARPRDQQARGVESHNNDKEDTPKQMRRMERRSGKDRRHKEEGRDIYDMRSNPGRRKTDRNFPSIETDA